MEIWKDIKDYEGKYQVSNLGKVKSLNYKNSGKEQIMIPQINGHGYFKIKLRKENITKQFSVHRLVYQAFKGKLVKGLVIDHISGLKTQNNIENLQQILQRNNVIKGEVCQNVSSKYVGVNYYKKSNKWRANISIGNDQKHLGLFKTELEATQAYQKALKNI